MELFNMQLTTQYIIYSNVLIKTLLYAKESYYSN